MVDKRITELVSATSLSSGDLFAIVQGTATKQYPALFSFTTSGEMRIHEGISGAGAANTSADDLVVEGSGSTGISILTPNANWSNLFLGAPSGDRGGQVSWNFGGAEMHIGTRHSNGRLLLLTGNSVDALHIDESQHVGIGESSPLNKLDISGGVVIGSTYSGVQTAPSNGLLVEGEVGIGTSLPDGTLHIHTATAGAAAASSVADDLVVENSADCGLGILNPDASGGWLVFGTPSDNLGAYANWEYSTSVLTLGTHKAGSVLRFMTGNNAEAVRITDDKNLGLATTNQFGGGAGVLGISNVTSAPASNPTNAGVIYVESGHLKYRGTGGTVTTVASA